MYRSFFMLMVLFLFSESKAQNPFEEHYCSKANLKSSSFNPMMRSYTRTADYDLKYYRFEWTVDPAQYYISGVVTPYFLVLESGFSSIYFDLSKAMTIDSILWHGQKLGFEQPAEYGLEIRLPEEISQNSLDSLSIFYRGVPPSSGFGSFIQTEHSGTPVLWTLSEPFGAQDWWPCKNGLDDKIDSIDVIVTTPEIYRAASNGVLISEPQAVNGKKTYHWKHRHAITPYLVAIAVTNYEVYEDIVTFADGKEMPMVNYVYPESLTQAKVGTADNVRVLTFFDSLFVEYPFKNEKYGHAQFSWGGGMEHQTMSFVINYGWGLLAHELAHQWFGDYVTCGSWEDIWLNEGFATYLEGLSRERFPQSNSDWYNWKLSKINSVTSNPGGSVKVDNPTSVNRIFSGRLSYNKGSYLLHMLRWKLGDATFFEGLRRYLRDRKYNYATTDQLRGHLEDISGFDLTSFFEQWYEGQGYPTYNITWAGTSETLKLMIEQVPSHPSVNYYDIPVPLRLNGAGQTQNISIEITGRTTYVELPLDFEVENVLFDPELWLLAKSNVEYDESLLTGVAGINEQKIRIYPNPVGDQLFMKGLTDQKIQYKIYLPGGQEVLHGECDQNRQVIDTHVLVRGMYFIECAGPKTTDVFRFVKGE